MAAIKPTHWIRMPPYDAKEMGQQRMGNVFFLPENIQPLSGQFSADHQIPNAVFLLINDTGSINHDFLMQLFFTFTASLNQDLWFILIIVASCQCNFLCFSTSTKRNCQDKGNGARQEMSPAIKLFVWHCNYHALSMGIITCNSPQMVQLRDNPVETNT